MSDNNDALLIAVEELVPNPRNARTHSRKQIRQVARSMERFGFTNPILVDDQLMVVAGHARLEAAKLLKLKQVPCRRLSGMSEADRRAYALADNALALQSGWDFEIVADELRSLSAEHYDLDLIGFDQTEIDRIIADSDGADPSKPDPADEVIQERSGWPVTRLGDLWCLGRHRLLCGDAKDRDVLSRLMGEDRATMSFLDGPYNVPIRHNVSGLGKTKHREFAEASGEMSFDQFVAFQKVTFENVEAFCVNGAIVFACMDWRHMREILAAGYAVFNELKNVCVWNKRNSGLGTFYRSQYELIFVWKVGDAEHINNFGLGATGRHRSNVWNVAGANSFRAGRAEDLADHPTVKPTLLVADAILDVSRRGDIVLDVFGGSGTTLAAAHRTGRIARLIEIDPIYCDVAIRRWQKITGKTALLESNGLSFERVSEERLGRATKVEAA